jgi:peptidyl-prolyl cis-trans isomerase SurA
MRNTAVIILLSFFTITGFSQKNKVLLTVGNEKVTADEFLHIYKKNNSDENNMQTVDEYLELYKKFKLKVVEAKSLQMDTSQAFIDELSGYRDQLAKPYLVENTKFDELIEEAYIRNQVEIKLDIIFIKLSKHASPEDTLKAYNKGLEIRKRIKEGEIFDSVAIETSDDRMVKKNYGHLSYLPVLRIPYPIQNYAFSDSKEELSLPIRTDYGYYLVRMVDTRPQQGFIKAAHIMISSTDQMSDDEKKQKEELADSLYQRILDGEDFEKLILYSDDKGTAKKGGELPEFSTGRMVPEFEAAAFALENPGDISKPVKTSFGWHIIKLIEKKPPQSKQEQKDKIKKTIERDPERKLMIETFVVNKLKENLKFEEMSGAEHFYTLLDSSIYKSKWTAKDKEFDNKILFTINGVKYNSKRFARFIENNQKRNKSGTFKEITDNLYEKFVIQSLKDSEINMLEENNSEFKYIMKEYHDGMLLFDLMKKEIWDKASEDTVGLKEFFNTNAEKYKNQFEINISVFEYNDDDIKDQAIKLLTQDRSLYSDSTLVTKLAENNTFSLTETGLFTEGQSKYADKIFDMMRTDSFDFEKKIYLFENDDNILYVNALSKKTDVELNDVKGLVIADYQTYLEEQWMEQLSKKYTINVDQKVLKKLKKSLK